MKRAVSITIVLALFFGLLTGCGKNVPQGMSEGAYDIGIKALDAADGYLDEKISAKKAHTEIESACNELENEWSAKNTVNYFLYLSVFHLEISLNQDISIKYTRDEIIEKRNSVAKELGKQNR